MTIALKPESIIDFWFGAEPLAPRAKWWRVDQDFDKHIVTNYAEAIEAAVTNQLDDWQSTAPGSLALIVLLDQMTRNSFRGTERAFSGDAKARQICNHGLGRGDLDQLHYLQAMFFCLPLQHSEELLDQEQSVRQMSRLQKTYLSDPIASHALRNCAKHAREHHEIIVRFGRFPHRNKALKRNSTPEEQQYLNDSKRFYGQA